MTEGRYLDPEATARYISVRVDALARLVKQGRIPRPDYTLGPRCPRWDREALDAIFKGDGASTDVRIAVRQHVENLRAESRARRQAHAEGRISQGLPLRTTPGARGGRAG